MADERTNERPDVAERASSRQNRLLVAVCALLCISLALHIVELPRFAQWTMVIICVATAITLTGLWLMGKVREARTSYQQARRSRNP